MRLADGCQRGSYPGPKGAALILTIIVLAVVEVVMVVVTAQTLAQRRNIGYRMQQLQTHWAARSAAEQGVAKLLNTAPTPEPPGTVDLFGCQVQTKVTQGPGTVHRIQSEARLSADTSMSIMRTVEQRYRRIVDGARVRLEPVPDAAAALNNSSPKQNKR